MNTGQPAVQGPFDHRMAVFGTDDGFLAAALPFLAEGLAARDEPPPVAVAAPGNLDLLRREWLPLLAVVVVSTALTLAVSALAFTAMARRGGKDTGA